MLSNWLPGSFGGWLRVASSFSTAVMCLGGNSNEVLGGGRVSFGVVSRRHHCERRDDVGLE